VIELIHLNILKHIFQLKKSTPWYLYMVNQVVSQLTLMFTVELFLSRLLTSDGLKIVNVLYEFLCTQYRNNTIKTPGLNVYPKHLDHVYGINKIM
jgi:hypothetical protein